MGRILFLWVLLHGFAFSSPLHEAAGRGEWRTVELLLIDGAEADSRDGNYRTPLMLTVRNAQHKKPEMKPEENNESERASRQRKRWRTGDENPTIDFIKTVDVLMEYHADIEAKDGDGWTALMIASSINQVDMVKILLDKGASTETKDNTNWTALLVASYAGQIKSVRVLIDRGADLTVVSNAQSTATALAYKNGFLGVMEVIRQASIRNHRMLLDRDINLMVVNGLGTIEGYRQHFR